MLFKGVYMFGSYKEAIELIEALHAKYDGKKAKVIDEAIQVLLEAQRKEEIRYDEWQAEGYALQCKPFFDETDLPF